MVKQGREEGSSLPCFAVTYFRVTVLVAVPPRVLRTVMFCGLLGQVKRPSYLPPPLLLSVPINWLVEVT